MPRVIEGQDRQQVTLMPECLDDFLADDNPVRVIDAFVSELDLTKLGFEGVEPAATGRPPLHPADLLKVYIYGYLNRVQSSRRLERECQRNIEMMWLTGASRRTSRRSRTSGATTAPASGMRAGGSSPCVGT
jgi:transposase